MSSHYITMEDEEGTKIGMSLPKELTAEKGIVTENSTVVYQTNKDVDMCVQLISGKQNDIPLDGIRELITIKSKDDPREYTFKFNMPKGYRLITSEKYCYEYNNKADEEKLLVEPGVVYIVDNHDRIQTVIDEPWATDANGAKIETRFSINGTSLIQHVDFANE